MALLHQVLPLGEHSLRPKIPGLAEEDELGELREEHRMDIRLDSKRHLWRRRQAHTLYHGTNLSIRAANGGKRSEIIMGDGRQ